MERSAYIYILSNDHRTTLYVGVTSDLPSRVFEHKVGKGSVFTRKYNLTSLVYYEELPNIGDAIEREKQLKKWRRAWKLELIHKLNPEMIDLSAGWYDQRSIELFRDG